jgi:hypothetical protein
MVSETVSFFNSLFGDALNDGHHLLVWSLPAKESLWCKTAESAESFCKALCDVKQDVYFGVCLAGKDHGTSRRCPADEVAAAVCLWADVDYADEVHKKPGLPTAIQAQKFIDGFPLRPSIAVHTGHGYQVYWLFREPLTFASVDENLHFQRYSAAWQKFLISEASKQGFVMDSVGDLARVLRVPGTVNYKGVLEARVHISHPDGAIRYNPSDFDDYVTLFMEMGAQLRLTGSNDPAAGGAVISTQEPPWDKYVALISAEPKFLQSFERTRKDLKDPSPSGYDMALANYTAKVGWTDQEITSLIIAARRKHGDDLKLREDYYRRTIAKARQSAALSTAGEKFLLGIDEAAMSPEERRSAVLKHLSDMFQIPIDAIVQYKSEDGSEFILKTGKGIIKVGEIANLTSQTSFRNIMADAAGVWLPHFNRGEWDAIVQALLDACTRDSAGSGTMASAAHAWVQSYLENSPPIADEAQVNSAIEARRPFVKGGSTFFFSDGLRAFIWHRLHERVGTKQLGVMLRESGCRLEKVNFQPKNGEVTSSCDHRTTRSVWKCSDSNENHTKA